MAVLSCTGWWEEVNLRPVLVLGGPRACSPSPSEVLVWSPLCRNWGAGFFFSPVKKGDGRFMFTSLKSCCFLFLGRPALVLRSELDLQFILLKERGNCLKNLFAIEVLVIAFVYV